MTVPDPARRAALLMADRIAGEDGTEDVFAADLATIPSELLGARVQKAPVSVITDVRGAGSSEMLATLAGIGIIPEFVGMVGARDGVTAGFPVAIARGFRPPPMEPAPTDFKVVAIVPVYNEEDVIELAIEHLNSNGVRVYLLDNWSTDDTVAKAMRYSDQGLTGFERFPTNGPPDTYDLSALQERIEAIAAGLDADWVISNDADELRSSPWPGVLLKDALYHVHQQGYSAVNYTSLNFALTADTDRSGLPVGERLTWFRPEPPNPLGRLNTWRRMPGTQAELAWSGGHTVRFEGRRVFPYNFLIRHYPIRSIEQGRRKVFKERLPRFPVDERLKGWHSHYDRFREDRLVEPTDGLLLFDIDFNEKFLLERLTGVGFETHSNPTSSSKVRVARALRRVGLLDKALQLRWRISGRAAK